MPRHAGQSERNRRTIGAPISLASNLLLEMLTELGGRRPLTHIESGLVEEIVSRESEPFRWTPDLELELVACAKDPGGLRRFAQRHGISDTMVYQKHHRMKRIAATESETDGLGQ